MQESVCPNLGRVLPASRRQRRSQPNVPDSCPPKRCGEEDLAAHLFVFSRSGVPVALSRSWLLPRNGGETRRPDREATVQPVLPVCPFPRRWCVVTTRTDGDIVRRSLNFGWQPSRQTPRVGLTRPTKRKFSRSRRTPSVGNRWSNNGRTTTI